MRRKPKNLPAITSWDEVDNAFRNIIECEGNVDTLAIQLNQDIAVAKAKSEALAKPFQEQITQLGQAIKTFVESNRAELDGKTKQLNFGKAGFRASTSLVVPPSKVADIISKLKICGMDDCITTKESVNKDNLKRYPADIIESTGAYLSTKDDFWYEVDKETIKATDD